MKHKIRYIDDNAEQNNAKETPSKVSILSGHGTEDDDNDPDDKDLKSNQKSAKSGDLCIEIKLGKNILWSVSSFICWLIAYSCLLVAFYHHSRRGLGLKEVLFEVNYNCIVLSSFLDINR